MCKHLNLLCIHFFPGSAINKEPTVNRDLAHKICYCLLGGVRVLKIEQVKRMVHRERLQFAELHPGDLHYMKFCHVIIHKLGRIL